VNAPGVIVVPLTELSREEQLQTEVAELRAQLEQAQAELARTPSIPPAGADLVVLGGGWVGEYGGWLWLVRGGFVRRLWQAEPTEVEQAQLIRAAIARGLEDRRRNAS